MLAVQDRLFSGTFREPEDLCVISNGLGQDSSVMQYMMALDPAFRARYAPGRALSLASDTGSEHDETYEHARFLERFSDEHGLHFELITAAQGYHSPKWLSLEYFYDSGNRIGSKSYPKVCTWHLKIVPFYRRLERILADDYGVALGRKRGLYEYVALTGKKIRVLIGITAEEAKNRIDDEKKIPVWMAKNIERVYPLVELGMTRADCQDYARTLGLPVPYPSLCKYCPYKSPIDVMHMSRRTPADYENWVRMEQNKLAADPQRSPHLPPEKYHGVFGQRKTLPGVLEKAIEEHGHMTDKELDEHRMDHGHQVAQKY